jgi:hypothetical protein
LVGAGRQTHRFVRYYVQPGYGHGSGRFDPAWDSLTALDEWMSRNNPPAAPVVTDANPGTENRTRPCANTRCGRSTRAMVTSARPRASCAPAEGDADCDHR